MNANLIKEWVVLELGKTNNICPLIATVLFADRFLISKLSCYFFFVVSSLLVKAACIPDLLVPVCC